MAPRRNWKSAEELLITKAEWKALRAVYNLFRKLPDVAETRTYENSPMKPFFNMNHIAQKRDCGTAMCIGGHVGYIMYMGMNARADASIVAKGFQIREYVHNEASEVLKDLYYPFSIDLYWGAITPRMAAQAINNFMRDGHPQWRAIAGTMTHHENYSKLNSTIDEENL